MNDPIAETQVLPRWLRWWEQFWFTPADPTALALMRVCCGAILLYTLLVYSLDLQDYMGVCAWHDLSMRLQSVRERPVRVASLSGIETAPLPAPTDEFQMNYLRAYREKWNALPPPPYPVSEEQALYLDQFRARYNVDLRAYGLRPPTNLKEMEYVRDYMKNWGVFPPLPPPAYARNGDEAREIDEYRLRNGVDPRLLYARGIPAFSLWFHVGDPLAMAILHGLFVLSAFLFTIGCWTRFTSALAWFGSLCYIHRNPTMQFGADTMMNILLLYLMIGPCGAVFSVDRLLRRWWSKTRPGVVRAWHGFWKRPRPDDAELAPSAGLAPPAPSVSANIALRLVQIHLCIIYLVAGLTKLQGPAWWTGTAVWGALANYEFAPLQQEYYLALLRFVGSNQLMLSLLLTGGGYFTLAFEIGYPFLIWRPRLRWVFLGSAILLHGFIGMLMGLITFTMLMLVMNMAFLRKEEAQWILRGFGRFSGASPETPPRTPAPKLETVR